MKLQSLLVSLLLGAVMLSVAACSGGAATTNQTSPTSVPLPTQVTNAQSATIPAPTQVTSAQPTQTSAAQPTTVPPPTATSNNAPPASGSGALDLIANAMQAQASAKSFRSTSVTTTETGATSTTVLEYVAPDRVHMLRSGSAGPGSETITIKGQGTWQKIKGTWTKSPVDLSAAAFAFLDPKLIDQVKSSVNIGTLQLIGPDLLGTTPTFVYQYNMDIKGVTADGGDLKGSYKVWIGVTDHRVYKEEGDTDSLTKPGAKTHTLITYEYDINIQIQPPV
jgi:hypothetical protein